MGDEMNDDIKAYGNLMKIHVYVQKLSAKHPHELIHFKLYSDWSGVFGYTDHSQHPFKFITIRAFEGFEHLEQIINED
jgi:hypothetical protein